MVNPNYKNKQEALASKLPEVGEFQHSRLKEIGIQQPTYGPSDFMPTEKAKELSDYIELLECETRWWNPKTQRLEPWLLTIANQKVLVRDEPFPYWNCETLYVKNGHHA